MGTHLTFDRPSSRHNRPWPSNRKYKVAAIWLTKLLFSWIQRLDFSANVDRRLRAGLSHPPKVWIRSGFKKNHHEPKVPGKIACIDVITTWPPASPLPLRRLEGLARTFGIASNSAMSPPRPSAREARRHLRHHLRLRQRLRIWLEGLADNFGIATTLSWGAHHHLRLLLQPLRHLHRLLPLHAKLISRAPAKRGWGCTGGPVHPRWWGLVRSSCEKTWRCCGTLRPRQRWLHRLSEPRLSRGSTGGPVHLRRWSSARSSKKKPLASWSSKAKLLAKSNP